MRWPSLAVERVRPSRFRPPFCPWPECPAHHGPPARFHRHGVYRRPSDRARIPRYRCLACGRTCSRQTFSCTYYLKRRHLPPLVAAGLVACSAHRQIARSLGCAKTTVTRAAERLTRHAILFQARSLAHLGAVSEPVVHDHFETFVQRQDHALGIGTAVGSSSWFVLDVDPAPHRGSGRRPDRSASQGFSPPPSSYVASILRTLDRLAPLVPEDGMPLPLASDGRSDYRVALAQHPAAASFRLEAYPNPERGPKGSPRSREAVVRDAAMFPADQLHQLVRHSTADHKRETIAFSRRLESIVGRVFLGAVWKNFVKGRSERKPDRRTPAMLLALSEAPWSWSKLLRQRLFPAREPVPAPWRKLYGRSWSEGLPTHAAKHTF